MTAKSKTKRVVILVVALVALSFTIWWFVFRQVRHSPAYFEAQKFAYEGEWQRAIPLYSRAFKENPADAACLARRGFTYGQLGDYKQAFADFEEALKIDRNCPDAYSRRARVYTWLGLQTLAKKDAKRALEIIGKPAEEVYPLLEHGSLLETVGEEKQAADEFQRALALNNGDRSTAGQLGDVFLMYKMQKYAAALETVNGLMLRDPEKPLYFRIRGDIYIAEKKFDLALKDFERYTFKLPEDPRGLYSLAICLCHTDKDRWATNCLETVCQKVPNYLEAYLGREAILTRAGLYDQSLKCISKVIELETEESSYYARRAFVYCKLNDWAKAKADAEKAIALNPRNDFAYSHRSWAKQKLGDKEGAIADMNKALEIAPRSSEMYYSRALTYRDLKKYPEAIEDFQTSLKLNPNKEMSHCALGSALLSSGQFKAAILACTKSIRLNPARSHPYFTRGSAYSRIGDYKLALKDLDHCITEYPNYGEAFYERSKVYKALGKEKQAKADMAKAVKYGYDKPEAM